MPCSGESVNKSCRNHCSGGVLTFMAKLLGSFGVYLHRSTIFNLRCYPGRHPLTNFPFASGQALVEFTLTFLLLLIVAWIPADFGLAFYTGQLAHNAAREGARIAAADPTLISGTTSCVMPACSGNIFQETAARLSPALLPAATITLNLEADTFTNCNRMVTVTVSGTYNFFFYGLLRSLGISGNLNNTPITRQTRMRWEGQAGCS
jgi:TadE-like protein